jgi:hypothetical protein
MMPKLAQVALFSIGLALVSVMYGDQLLSRAGWGCLIVATVWILGKSTIKTGNKMIAYPLIALAILSGLQGIDIISRVMPAILIGVYLVSTRDRQGSLCASRYGSNTRGYSFNSPESNRRV